MAFGGGVAVVNRAMDSVLGPRTIRHETATTGPSTDVPAATANSFGSDACNIQSKAFQDVSGNMFWLCSLLLINSHFIVAMKLCLW